MKIFWNIVQWSVVSGFIIVFVFVINSYHYLIYALIAAFLLYFPLKKIVVNRLSKLDSNRKVQYEVNGKPVSIQMNKLTAFGVLLALAYIVIVTIFSVSPYLERKEFRITHPSWVAVMPSIRNLCSNLQGGKTKYAYIDLEYQFTADGQSHGQKIVKAEKLYSFLPIWGKQGLEKIRIELLDRASRKNTAKEYIVFYNPDNPKQNKFFLANDCFYPQGAWLYDLLFVYFILFLFIMIIVLLFRTKNRISVKNQIV